MGGVTVSSRMFDVFEKTGFRGSSCKVLHCLIDCDHRRQSRRFSTDSSLVVALQC